MYRRPKFLEVLLDIRREMAEESDYDSDLFAELVRSGRHPKSPSHSMAYDEERKEKPPKSPGSKQS